MSYTILLTNGTVLTTIPDGTINTTSTSLGLPGRNYAGYGQPVDENFVWLTENFANATPPANPLAGQLWFNTNTNTLLVCPAQGTTNANAWLSLAQSGSSGTTTFGNVTVSGNITAGNANITNTVTANLISVNFATIASNANIGNANITSANIGTLTTQVITAGSQSTSGTLTGVWTANGSGTANGTAGTSMWVTGGNLLIQGGGNIGIRTDYYYYANGNPISFAGTYSNSNVQAYLPNYSGNVGLSGGAAVFNGSTLSTGANTNSGTITGNWSLSAGSRLNATYADLAERFAADDVYAPGTVVQLGGKAEITAVQYELSEDVFGVISNTAAYLMNAGAGDDNTHPPVAVTGRVEVKVTGKVNKGDRLVSAGEGIARAAKSGEATAFNTIGRALADKLTDDGGTVEAIVMIR
jgi:hypothetical protein